MHSEDGLYSCPHTSIKMKLDKMWKYSKELAMANSHGKACEKHGDGFSYEKWCVLCGKPFTTVNETRQTCAECQEEIFRKDDLEKIKRARERNMKKKSRKKSCSKKRRYVTKMKRK